MRSDDDDGTDSGSAYIFQRHAGGEDNWGEVAKLTASDAGAGDYFGYAVAISGDVVAIGAYGEDSPTTNSGAVYLFERDSGGTDNWGQTAKLGVQSPTAADNLGINVAIDGEVVVAGAWTSDVTAGNAGAAYVYVKPGGGWSNMTETAELTASDGVADDRFGYSVDVSGDVVVVGAFWHDDTYTDEGAAYVFVKPGGGWADMTQTGKLTPSDPAASDLFGAPVAIEGDWIAVGSVADDDNGSGSGSMYLYEKPGTGWADMTQTLKRVASDGSAVDGFGRLSLDGTTILCGATGTRACDSRGTLHLATTPRCVGSRNVDDHRRATTCAL